MGVNRELVIYDKNEQNFTFYLQDLNYNNIYSV